MSNKKAIKEAIAHRQHLRAIRGIQQVEQEIVIRDRARNAIIGSIVTLSGRTLNARERRAINVLIKASRSLKVN